MSFVTYSCKFQKEWLEKEEFKTGWKKYQTVKLKLSARFARNPLTWASWDLQTWDPTWKIKKNKNMKNRLCWSQEQLPNQTLVYIFFFGEPSNSRNTGPEFPLLLWSILMPAPPRREWISINTDTTNTCSLQRTRELYSSLLLQPK